MSEEKKKRYPLKYFHIFTWMYLVLIKRRDMTLEDVYHYTVHCADTSVSLASWWDVFDGVCWICSFVFGLILTGYILS
jgi:hypothetical protein